MDDLQAVKSKVDDKTDARCETLYYASHVVGALITMTLDCQGFAAHLILPIAIARICRSIYQLLL